MCLVLCLRVYLCVGELQYDQYSALLFYRPARYTRCVNTNKWLAAFCESVCVCSMWRPVQHIFIYLNRLFINSNTPWRCPT